MSTDSPTPGNARDRRRGIMSLRKVLILLVVVAAVPVARDFIDFGQRSKSNECKLELMRLFASERHFFQQQRRYTVRIADLQTQIARGNRYSYHLAADGPLAQGDPAAALKVLARRVLFEFEEVELHARLSAAHLEVEPDDPWKRLQKACALARSFRVIVDYCENGKKPQGRFKLHDAWSWERITEVAERAHKWLCAWGLEG